VLLLDKQQFPRVKPCGGGISIKALNLMPWSVAPVIERAVKKLGMGVTSPVTERFEVFEAKGHVCTFAVREAFDRFNFEKTIEAGVEFEHTAELSGIDERSDFVRANLGNDKRLTSYRVPSCELINRLPKRVC
jgi:flavin-dependent dehydrogenase